MIRIKSPGRICLFGEHQDYFNLPVISMAISLHSTIIGRKINSRKIIIHKKDLDEIESFSLDDLKYDKKRDYFKSGVVSCVKEGLEFSNGFEVSIESNIPMQAGCGSSSSIMVGWIYFLSKMSDQSVDWSIEKIGELAYAAEVLNFKEPGGMMDQYSSALGGLIYLNSQPKIYFEKLNPSLGFFILADSLDSKPTMEILSKCKKLRLNIINKISTNLLDFDLSNSVFDQVRPLLNDDEVFLMEGTFHNRDLLWKGLAVLKDKFLDHVLLGNLLYDQHKVLRDVLEISTVKIENMMKAAMDAGALGGKITGSGGGGCMFVYGIEQKEKIMDAIRGQGGVPYLVHPSLGVLMD